MKRILIIEDDELIAELERDYLEAGGFEVEMELDGREGLKKALTGEYDAMILDLMLPGINGFEICRKVREKLNLPVIMVTARKEDIDKIRGLGFMSSFWESGRPRNGQFKFVIWKFFPRNGGCTASRERFP